jgi:regulator of sigma E protease
VNIALFVAILIGLVILHEAGHMVVAKLCGMRVERFMVFMGKPLISFRRGETEYGIGWLPLGGYVKISGMTREEELPPEVRSRAYYSASFPRKFATILAGPAVNIVLAYVLFALIFWVGAPTLGNPTNVVAAVEPDSPAATIGLRPGDRLLSVDGVPARPGDITALREELRSQPGEPVTVVFERDGRRIERTTIAEAVEENGQKVGRLGFVFDAPIITTSYGPVEGLQKGGELTWEVVKASVSALGRLFVSEEARSQVNSVVGVGVVFNEVADDGTIRIIQLAALISLALGIFNLLPFLPLDGGHILFAAIERIKGSALPRGTFEKASFVGMALILVVFFIAIQNDISLIRDGTLTNIDR